jgi:hypothetical protein
MERNNNICAGMESKLAEMLLDAEIAPVEVKAHVQGCEGCRRELEELRATMSAMDAWEAPEPNPYFMTRFEARLREEKRRPAGWLERLRTRMMLRQQMHVKPLAALSLTVMLFLGGGAYLQEYWRTFSAAPAQTAVVHDLQTLDNNAQLLDEMDQISGDTGDDGQSE